MKLSVIVKFKKMKKMLTKLRGVIVYDGEAPSNIELVAAILRERSAETLGVSEDGIKVGRLVPMANMESEELVALRTVEVGFR